MPECGRVKVSWVIMKRGQKRNFRNQKANIETDPSYAFCQAFRFCCARLLHEYVLHELEVYIFECSTVVTYDHRLEKTGHSGRSAIHKLEIDWFAVGDNAGIPIVVYLSPLLHLPYILKSRALFAIATSLWNDYGVEFVVCFIEWVNVEE